MSPQPPDPDSDPYLAERLAETRDWSAFSRPQLAVELPQEIEKETLHPELGGRRILDRFIRDRPETKRPIHKDPPADTGLESHLKSRLGEVTDQAVWHKPDAVPDPIEAYQQLRRRWGGNA
jgi:hypothetical protein